MSTIYTEKTYSLEQVETFLKHADENEKRNIVRLYPSQKRMVDNFRLAYAEVEKTNFKEDVNFSSHIKYKKDKWKFGFLKTYSAKDRLFKAQYSSDYQWAVNMFGSIAKRIDFNYISEWQSTVLQTDRVQEEIRVMIGYYRPTSYFSTYIKLYDAGVNLNEEQYNKLCKNKYASKVLQAHFSEPLFKVGEIVSLRGSLDGLERRKMHKGMFVVSNTEAITSARKGCKKYKVLPVGGIKPLFFEESQLKKYKKIK